MRWLEIHIDTNHGGLERVEAFLSTLGIDDIVVDDEEEFRAFAEENRPQWGDVDEALLERESGKSRVTFYLRADESGFAALAAARLALSAFKRENPDCGSLLMTLEDREEADWENAWKQYYRPMEIGRRLLVVPEWEHPDPGDRIPLILDPGVTFGTGSHATTQLCLAALEETIQGGEQVLDLGCGSGILSVAALKLGAERAFAYDIDEKCIGVSYDNARRNAIGPDRLTVRCGDVLRDDALRAEMGTGYDVILANIVADVILALAPAIRPLLKPGGRFITSGILTERRDEVRLGLEAAGLAVEDVRESDGWVCFLCR